MARETTVKSFELNYPELFKNLSEIQIGNIHVDLHNNYDCYQINYSKETHELKLSFKTSMEQIQSITHLDIIFENVVINSMSFDLGDVKDMMTIDNLYRGKYQEKDKLKEFTEDGKAYYYLEFYRGYTFELFANKIIVAY